MTAPAPTAPRSLCSSFVGARVMRATLVDACGRPMWGLASQLVTKGFISVTIDPEVEAGEIFKIKNAAGELCINDRLQDTISWYNLTIEFCQVDPELFTMLNRAWKPVTDAARTTITGYRQGQQVSDTLGYALELWPRIVGSGAGASCLAGSDPTIVPNGYLLLPWILAFAPDTVVYGNNAASFKMKGRTKAGSLWGKGPYNVTRDITGVPARLLDYLDPGFDVPSWALVSSGNPDPIHTEIVTVAPPVAGCGSQALWNPDAIAPVVTTVATTGTPHSVDLAVTNFALVGNSATVNWGDGTSGVLTAGVNAHLYAAPTYGVAQTITVYPGDAAAPAVRTFTP